MPEPRPGDRLPVLDVIDELLGALESPGAAVLVAPPGTGKTTGVPPLLRHADWIGTGRIMVLEPRRLAARMAATRMAEVAGEEVGGTFGYAVRGERRTSSRTRVEVVTEGLFVRRLQSDPTLDGVSAVLLDEFHERSIDTDLALALLLDVRQSLRPDLRIVVMSATLDAAPIAELLGTPTTPAPVVEAVARMYPVDTRYRPGSAHDPLEERIATVVIEALQERSGGDLLVFLPGRPEIHRTERVLARIGLGDVVVERLHGSLSPAEQEHVVRPSIGGPRRVILSTSLAETSITVPGVRTVIDAGRRRTVRADSHTGLPAMTTVAASRAAADQRRGRAGRVGPGTVYRLWAESDDRHRPMADTPEIVDGDLAPLVLQLRSWGVDDPATLSWLDPPDGAAVEHADELLRVLGAVQDGRLTTLGRRAAEIGFHPRLAAVALAGEELSAPDLAAELVAVLETSRSGELDVAERLRALHRGESTGDTEHAARQWRRTMGLPSAEQRRRSSVGPDDAALDAVVGRLLLAGYPDRVARRRDAARTDDSGRDVTVFHLRSGGEVALPAGARPGADPRPGAGSSAAGHHLHQARWVVVADLDGGSSGRSGRLHLGTAVDEAIVAEVLGAQIVAEDVVEWEPRTGDIVALRRERLGAIVMREERLRNPPADAVAAAVLSALRDDLSLLGRLDRASELRSRVAFLRATASSGADRWPDWSTDTLAATIDDWLGSFLGRVRRRGDLARVDVLQALTARLTWEQREELDQQAPTTWSLAGGRKVSLRYGEVDGDPASVTASVRLRDLIGTDTHPTVGGSVPVSIELLSPAGRPVQRTSDLPGFWRGSYSAVRADLRGRYPKHPWPARPWEPR